MTRERLEGLPLNVLLDLAQKEGLSPIPDSTREVLIEDLFEAYEEDQRERETLQNLILKMEQTKFALPPESAKTVVVQEPVLPSTYDCNSVDLVLRDPEWALGLWEVRRKDLDAWTQEPGFRGLTLRVVEYETPGQAPLTFFPIPVPQEAGSRYLNLPTPGHWYALELHVSTEKESRLLARSSLVLAPPERAPNPMNRPGLTPEEIRILAVSGAGLCETVPAENSDTVSAGFPQRIGGWDESEFEDAAE